MSTVYDANAPARPLGARAEELVEALAAEVTARVLARLEHTHAETQWMTVPQAAEHLACSRQRLYTLVHERRVPHHHEGARLLFERGELDAWVRKGGAA